MAKKGIRDGEQEEQGSLLERMEKKEKRRKESMNARAAGRRNPVILLLLLPCWLDIFSIRPPPSLYLQGDTFIFFSKNDNNISN